MKSWDPLHLEKCGWYLDCPIKTPPTFDIALRNSIQPAFQPTSSPPTMGEKLPYTEPPKGKRKKFAQVSEQYEDNVIVIGEPSSKKRKVLQPATPSEANPILPSVLEPFSSLRIKTKPPQMSQCNSDKDSFELILNDSFLNIFNVKEKTKTWPQSFHDINAFLTKVFSFVILSNRIFNYQ
jgi:hypothetical protein